MKKLPKEISNKIKLLKKVQPSDLWKSETKSVLMRQLKFNNDTVKTSISAKGVFGFYFHDFISRLLIRPAGIFIIIGLIVVGPSIATVKAAEQSLPGDFLYGVRDRISQAKVMLAIDEESKVQVHVNNLEHLAHGLDKIAREHKVEKKKKAQLTVDELRKNTDKVKKSLQDAPNDKAVVMAEIINSSDYQQTLESIVDQVEVEGQVKKEINEAVIIGQEVDTDALDIIVKNKAKGEADKNQEENTPEQDEENKVISEKIDNKIKTTQKIAGELKLQIENLLQTISTEQNTDESESDNQNQILVDDQLNQDESDLDIETDKISDVAESENTQNDDNSKEKEKGSDEVLIEIENDDNNDKNEQVDLNKDEPQIVEEENSETNDLSEIGQGDDWEKTESEDLDLNKKIIEQLNEIKNDLNNNIFEQIKFAEDIFKLGDVETALEKIKNLNSFLNEYAQTLRRIEDNITNESIADQYVNEGDDVNGGSTEALNDQENDNSLDNVENNEQKNSSDNDSKNENQNDEQEQPESNSVE